MKKFEQILKAGKYKSKKMVNGRWVYDYGKKSTKKEAFLDSEKVKKPKVKVKNKKIGNLSFDEIKNHTSESMFDDTSNQKEKHYSKYDLFDEISEIRNDYYQSNGEEMFEDSDIANFRVLAKKFQSENKNKISRDQIEYIMHNA